MPLVEETIEIRVRPEELFPVIEDVEKFPDFMEGVKRVTYLEKGADYNISEWINEVDGRVVRWIEKDYPKQFENRIDFELVEGDLKKYYGFWQLEDKGETTKVIFSIYFEFGIPMLAGLLHPLLAKKLRDNMQEMLVALKAMAEGVNV